MAPSARRQPAYRAKWGDNFIHFGLDLIKKNVIIKGMKDREIDWDRRVYVYRNLHKNCWSVRQDGLIVQHTKAVSLKDVRFLVGQTGRKRVLKEKRKNVHAGISGYLMGFRESHKDINVPRSPAAAFFPNSAQVVYNPYKYKTFVKTEDRTAVKKARFASLSIDNGVFAYMIEE